ncbi:LytTR family DNA-binding domain-containing protein [Maribacter sp.]|nr:LytTR family DNA-binding domain-containing protein [Maribacter sp.]
MIRCLIIDDEPLAIEVITAHLAQLSEMELVASFGNPVAALETLKRERIDVIFLDIEMPVLSGIDFIKNIAIVPKVIFTTAYRNYAIESYELDVVDYLLKPISFSRFLKAVNKFKTMVQLPVAKNDVSKEIPLDNHIYVNANKKFIKLEFDAISYVESMKDYVKIHTAGKSVVTKEAISNFAEKLPSEFLRIHRSFIVNTKKVTAFTKVDVEINETELPIGSSYKEAVMAFLKKG